MALVDRIILALEDEGIKLMSLDDVPTYDNGPNWERADEDQVREIIAATIAKYICEE